MVARFRFGRMRRVRSAFGCRSRENEDEGRQGHAADPLHAIEHEADGENQSLFRVGRKL